MSNIVQVNLHIQVESNGNVSVLWSGNTYNFRMMLDDVGVRGAYRDEENGGTRTYYRCLRNIDITLEPNKVKAMIEETFSNLAMKVIIESDPIENSDTANWIYDLRKLDCLHFDE